MSSQFPASGSGFDCFTEPDSSSIHYFDYSGATPPFQSQLDEEAWKEERAAWRKERALREAKDAKKREIIVISSSPPGSPSVTVEKDKPSGSRGIYSREMMARIRRRKERKGKAKEVQPEIAVPKRKRDIGTDPIENGVKETSAGGDIPHKKQRTLKHLAVDIPTDACSVKVVIKFAGDNVE